MSKNVTFKTLLFHPGLQHANLLNPPPQTFLAGMHAQLRPIGGRSEPDFSLYKTRNANLSFYSCMHTAQIGPLGCAPTPGQKNQNLLRSKRLFCLRAAAPCGEYALCNAAPPKAAWRRPLWPCRGYSQSRALRNRDIKKRGPTSWCNALCNAV